MVRADSRRGHRIVGQADRAEQVQMYNHGLDPFGSEPARASSEPDRIRRMRASARVCGSLFAPGAVRLPAQKEVSASMTELTDP